MVQVSFYISEGLMILWVFLETTKSFPLDPLRQDEGGGNLPLGILMLEKDLTNQISLKNQTNKDSQTRLSLNGTNMYEFN